MTYRELKEKLEKFTDEQLDTTVIYAVCGNEVGDSTARPGTPLSLDIADFELYYYESTDDYIESCYPGIPLEELKEDEGKRFDEDNVIMLGISKGTPFLCKD